MNTMRVFLHDQLWEQDAEGFRKRIDEFLTIAARHEIKPLLVFFDSCWDPNPKLGPQHPPIPGRAQLRAGCRARAARASADAANYPKLKVYVQGVIRAFAKDDRILGWDMWNEPDNAWAAGELVRGAREVALVSALLPQVFAWAREADPAPAAHLRRLAQRRLVARGQAQRHRKIQIEQSDFITFHVYDWPEVFERSIKQLRPMAGPSSSPNTWRAAPARRSTPRCPSPCKYNVGMINWGFVVGKTQTQFPWDSWQKPYTGNPPVVWHHDIFHADGKPYRQAEVDQIRALTARLTRRNERAAHHLLGAAQHVRREGADRGAREGPRLRPGHGSLRLGTGYNPRHPEVLRINPKRQVPVLMHGPVEIFDSTQIFEYLEDMAPTPPLWPRDLIARARRAQSRTSIR